MNGFMNYDRALHVCVCVLVLFGIDTNIRENHVR